MQWIFEARKYLDDDRFWKSGQTKRDILTYLKSAGASFELLQVIEELELDPEEEFYGLDELFPDLPTMAEFYHGQDEDEV